MEQTLGKVLGTVIGFAIWAALLSFMWETHFLAGLMWTVVPIAIAGTIAAKYLKS